GVVENYLRGGGRGTVKEIAKAVGRNEDDVRDALDKLRRQGNATYEEVPPEGGKGRRRKIWYWISAPGKVNSRSESKSRKRKVL
ncbi:MAG: hypothetical protein ACYSTI_13735, partial [Planctomycetota bacterium]